LNNIPPKTWDPVEQIKKKWEETKILKVQIFRSFTVL